MSYTIRPFETVAELRECVELQEETWGRGFSERVPPAILKVSQILGGVAAGAYGDDGRLEGFVFGMTGVRDGEIVHWSDMLAVRSGARDRGLGARLKAYQRERMLAQGVSKVFWTFDPLQSRNAYLNFSKLGIVVREYREDMYGQTDSPLHRGIGTDRFVALWQVDSERVRRRMEEGERGPGPEAARGVPSALEPAGAGSADAQLAPGEPDLTLTPPELLVAIPEDIVAVMERSMQTAVAWRSATRSVLTHYLARGYEVRELLRGARLSRYLLRRI